MQQHFIRLLHTAPPPHIQPPVTRRLSSVPAAGDGEQLTERQPEGTVGERKALIFCDRAVLLHTVWTPADMELGGDL